MKPKHTTHAAGSAAYTRRSSSQEDAEPTASPEESGETDSGVGPQDTTFQETPEEGLSAQEQRMIEEKFPEDPELSMRLYGQQRDARTVRGRAVGENIDVVG
jgi:hypothetical protein